MFSSGPYILSEKDVKRGNINLRADCLNPINPAVPVSRDYKVYMHSVRLH